VGPLQKGVNEQRNTNNCEECSNGWMNTVKAGAIYYQFAVLSPVTNDYNRTESY
jgi:hypothetical protein